jgi:hypothetical protein
MKKDTFQKMLAECCTSEKGGAGHSVADQDQLTMLVAIDGSLLPVERVSRVELRADFVQVESARSEVYLVELSRVVGFKLKRGSREGTGFLSG